MPVLSNQRHEGVAQAYIADPEKVGWKAYKKVYPKSSQHAAETGFSRLLLKNAEFASRVAELQGAAATNAEITLGSLLREVGEIQQAAMAAKQYSAANGAVKLKASFRPLRQRKEDVTPHRSEAEIIARVHRIVVSADEARSGGSAGGAAKLPDQATLN